MSNLDSKDDLARAKDKMYLSATKIIRWYKTVKNVSKE